MNLHCNGFVIQKVKDGLYQGIEGDNWFLNYEDKIDKEMVDYFDEYIDLAWSDDERVDVCNDFNYIRKYMDVSIDRSINFRIIMCYTPRERPEMIDNEISGVFMGYDYAYSGGSYYSAVFNDVVSRRIPSFFKFKLNSYGLFESQNEIFEFVDERNRIVENSTEYNFEDGDFIIYKLYELKMLNNEYTKL